MRWLARFGTLLALAIIVAGFSIARPDAFSTAANLINISQQMAPLAIVAAGATFVMVIAEFDLAVGFLASLAAVVAVSLLGPEVGVAGIVGAIAAALAGAAAVGAVSGFLVARFRAPSFIASLAIGTVVSGLSYWITGGASIFQGIPEGFKLAARWKIGDVSVLTAWMALALVAAGVALERTEFGRRLYAIGGNRAAARLAGAPVRRDTIAAFAISGLFAGAAGVLLAGRVGSVQHDMGDGMLLPAYAAVFLGATAFRDGEPNIAGTALGVAIIAVLANGMTIVGVKPFYQDMLTGGIIVLAVLVRSLARASEEE